MLANFFNQRSLFSDFDRIDRTFNRLMHRMEHDFRDAFTPFDNAFAPLSLPFDKELSEAEGLVKPFLDSTHFKSLFDQDFDFEKLTPPAIEDEENTFYKMKVLTDHNGHVKTKTMEKQPGKEWQVKMEEYDRKTGKAIEQGEDDSNKENVMPIENKDGEEKKMIKDCQIESEKY